MAEAALLDQETEVSQPPQAASDKRKPGRQPGYKPFSNESTPEDFMARTAAITDAEWPTSLVYVWRRDPYTDTTNGGREPKYIDVINRAFTIDSLKEEHGSGTYKLILNTNEKYQTHCILTIDDPKFPPHVPPGDWQNHPRNKKWQSWKPLIDKWWSDRVKTLSGATEAQNGALSQADLIKLLTQRTDGTNNQKEQIFGAIIGILPQLLQQQNNANDPGKMLEAFSKLKELLPTPTSPLGDLTSQLILKLLEPKQDPMMPFLMEQLKGLQQQNTELLKTMLASKTASEKQPGPLEQMKQMSEIMQTVAGFVTPAEPKAPWQSIVEEGLPGLLDMGKAYFMSKSMFENARAGARPSQPQVVQHPQPVPVAQPAPQPNPPPSPAPAPQVMNPTVENPQVVEIDQMAASNLVLIAQYARKALELNLDGFQFQDSVFANKFGVYTGEQIYQHFTTSFPKEHVLDMLRAVPQAWQEISQWEAILPQFIEQFYTAPVDEEEPPPPIEPKPAKKKGPKK